MIKPFTVTLLFCSFVMITACTTAPTIDKEDPHYCTTVDDCVPTCGMGCVNKEFYDSYEDPCVNIRSPDCTCVNNECYSDGQPPLREP